MKEFYAKLYEVELAVKANSQKSFENKLSKLRKEAFSSSEHSQPTMLKVSRLVYDMTPCEAIEHVMTMQCPGTEGLNCQLKEIADGVEAWLSENREHVEVFSRFVDGFRMTPIDEYRIAFDGLLNITPEAERRYLNCTAKEEEKRIRLKVLAALGVYTNNAFLRCSTQDNDAASVGCHMFFLFRSIVQFASCTLHRKGIRHTKLAQEGGRNTKSRDGYAALIQRVCSEFPEEELSAQMAWRKIIAHLLNSKRAMSYSGSKFFVLEDPTSADPYSFALREERAGKRYNPIKFNTFRSIFSRLKSSPQRMDK